MKYLYLKLIDETAIVPVNNVCIYNDNDEIIRIDNSSKQLYDFELRQKNEKFAAQVMEDLANWLAKDKPDTNVFEIDSY